MEKVVLDEHKLIYKALEHIDYIDSFSSLLKRKDIDNNELISAFFTSSPPWVDKLFTLRNKLLGFFGFKTDMGELDAKPPFIEGQKVGFFYLYILGKNEVIMGEDDKHLDFRVSFLTEENKLIITTAVMFKNKFGKIYFFIVKPFHKIIVAIMVKNMGEKLNAGK